MTFMILIKFMMLILFIMSMISTMFMMSTMFIMLITRFEELQVEIDRLRTMNIDLIKKVRIMNEERRNSSLKTKNHISVSS